MISASDCSPLAGFRAGFHWLGFWTSSMMRLDDHRSLLSAGLASTIISERVVASVPRVGRIPQAGRPQPWYGFLGIGVASEI